MVQSRCRISYVVPPPLDPVPRLHLPPSGTPRIGSTSPLILPDQNVSSGTTDEYSPKHLNHPRHRLGVASLAIDTSTLLAGRNTPEGILYTGGRDGMVMSWDLGFPMKKRRPKFRNGSIRRSVGRWEIMTGWADDVIDEEAEEADDRYVGSDGDILGEVSANNSRRKKMLARKTSIPFENEWETDLDAFTPEIVRWCPSFSTPAILSLIPIPYSSQRIFASALKHTQTGSTTFFYVITIRQVCFFSPRLDTSSFTSRSNIRFFRWDYQSLEPSLTHIIGALHDRLTLRLRTLLGTLVRPSYICTYSIMSLQHTLQSRKKLVGIGFIRPYCQTMGSQSFSSGG